MRRWSSFAGGELNDECVAGTGGVDARLVDGPSSDARSTSTDGGTDAPPGAGMDAAPLDTAEPDTTIVGKPGAISGPSVTFMFEANEAASFQCSLDDGAFDTCGSPKSYNDLAATPNPHRFQVRARDLAGNVDSSPAVYTWQVDPSVLDTSITVAPAATSGPSAMFSFTATRAGGRFECRLAPVEAAFTTCTSPKSYSGLRDTNNPYAFAVRAIDAAENVDDTPAIHSWTVDSSGPVVDVSSPSGTTGTRPTIVFNAESGAAYTCRFDSGVAFSCTTGVVAPSTLGGGAHVLRITGTDALDNVGPEKSQSFNVDATPPMFTSFDAPAEGSVSGPSVTVTYALSEGSVTRCTLDGAPLPSCGSPLTMDTLTVDRHMLVMTATDAVGNTADLSRTWVVPPVANFPAANLLIGQPTYVQNNSNEGGESAHSLNGANGIHSNGTLLWIEDGSNFRILQWTSAPTVSNLDANIVLGQATATAHDTGGVSETKFGAGGKLCFGSGRLYFADSNNNRILVWSPVPSANLAAASLVLGQTSFSTSDAGSGASQLRNPIGLWCDNTRVIVSDAGNHRVLIWSSHPAQSGQPADVVLGWPDFGMSSPVISPPTASSMKGPNSVAYDGQRLYVSDTNNHRVLVWRSLPMSHGKAADFVLGQTSFTANSPNAGDALGPVGMQFPTKVLAYGRALLVIDFQNRRIMVWTPVPDATGAPAVAVIGTEDLTTPPGTIGDNLFAGLRDMTIAGKQLWVLDHNRAMRFTLR